MYLVYLPFSTSHKEEIISVQRLPTTECTTVKTSQGLDKMDRSDLEFLLQTFKLLFHDAGLLPHPRGGKKYRGMC